MVPASESGAPGGTQLGSGKSGKPTSIEQRRRVDRARRRGLGKVRQDRGLGYARAARE
jgi:hypothetical protein